MLLEAKMDTARIAIVGKCIVDECLASESFLSSRWQRLGNDLSPNSLIYVHMVSV